MYIYRFVAAEAVGRGTVEVERAQCGGPLALLAHGRIGKLDTRSSLVINEAARESSCVSWCLLVAARSNRNLDRRAGRATYSWMVGALLPSTSCTLSKLTLSCHTTPTRRVISHLNRSRKRGVNGTCAISVRGPSLRTNMGCSWPDMSRDLTRNTSDPEKPPDRWCRLTCVEFLNR